MKHLIIGSIALAALLGCGGGGDGDGAGAGDTGGDAAPAAALGTATITGTVSFSGSAPENPLIDMAEEPQCAEKHAEAPRDPRVLVENGGLANAFIRVTSGLPEGATFPMPSSAAVIDQDGCLYRPRVLGVMVGQDLEIHNSDPLLHNIKAVPTANRGFNISQPRAGMTTTRTFRVPEIMVPLECNVHGWMNAFLGVVDHPYFATSGVDGSFSISGLPAGTYELEAWHEVFGTQTLTVTVADGGTASADISYTN